MGLKYILKYLTTTDHKLNEVLVMVRKRVKILTLDLIMYTEVPVMTTERIYLESSKRRRQWQPTPVLLPGKSHGWRSLVGCSPWDREEVDMTE